MACSSMGSSRATMPTPRRDVLELVRSIGFRPIDAGSLNMARALEAMAILREGAVALVAASVAACPTLAKLWADPGYSGGLGDWLKERYGIVLEIVAKLAGQEGFVPLPRRWVVERSFANLGRNRRLSKDYEFWEDASESMVYLASIKLLANRLVASA